MARQFKRQESWRLKRVKPSWRRPRGGTSRIRLEVSGWPRKPNVGFKTSRSVRGLHPSGLQERLVKQEKDFDGIDPKRHIVRLGHQLGEKKRLTLVEKARQMKVRIANPGTTEPAPRASEETPLVEESETGGIEQEAESTLPTGESPEEAASVVEDGRKSEAITDGEHAEEQLETEDDE